MSVIDKARTDRRLVPLLARIQQQIRIKFEKSRHDGWLTRYEPIADAGRAVIEYSNCPHPSATLARELLQLEQRLAGYRPIRLGISSAVDTDFMPSFINALDSELMNQKCYPAFIGMGFRADQFYRDSDKEVYAYLTHLLQAPPDTLATLIPPFLMLIAPGGAMPLDRYQELYDKFLALNGGAYTKQLLTMEEIIRAWGRAATLDQTETVRKIMLTLAPDANFTWFGFTDESGFPDQGFYVGEAFSVRVLPTDL